MPWYANQTLNTFIAKTDRLNRFDQYLVPNFLYVNNFLATPIVSTNLATCAVVYICCDWLWDGKLNHIELCICLRILFPPTHASVHPPFLHWSTSKNELPPVLVHPKKLSYTSFFLSTGLVNNPLIFSLFCNSVLYRYVIRNFCVAVLITPMKQITCFHNSSAAGTDAKYESVQTILSVLAHGSTSSFGIFLPWGILSSSSYWYALFLGYLTILRRIIILDCLHARFSISVPFSGFLYNTTYIRKPKFIQWQPCTHHLDMDPST